MLAPAEYQTIFEINVASFPWSAFLTPCLCILLGIAFYRFSKMKLFQLFGLIASAVGLFFVLLYCTALIPKYVRLRHAYKNGQTKLIEGPIENFHPMPSLGPSKESFSVGGVLFSYYVGEDSPCFTNGPQRKGPIHESLNVRIFYDDECIQRVDVRK